MFKVAFIPIDNRPVSYLLPKQIAGISCEIELMLPPRELLGGLTTFAQSQKILDWLSNIENIDAAVIALDTIAYGGLVSSRRSSLSYDEILKNILKLKDIIMKKNIKTYATSSIMRMSNNNVNEEEKDYWDLYGKKIFQYSYELHKNNLPFDSYNCSNNLKIPENILSDYLQTRKRNFDLNKFYLNLQKEKIFDYLVFSKDDCAEYGLNVKESHELFEFIKSNNLNAIVKTGADEIPLALFARAFSDFKLEKVKVYPNFLRPEYKDLISKYEDISIQNSVNAQIDLVGGILEKDEKSADVVLLVNNFEKEQGELVMGVETKTFDDNFEIPPNYAIADVAYANGADNVFVEQLLDKSIDFDKFFGYAAWNTSANTLGSVLTTIVVKFLSSKIDNDKFKEVVLTRLLDDWAYQANVRVNLKNSTEKLNLKVISDKMRLYEKQLKRFVNTNKQDIIYSLPWHRTFEIEITFDKK